MAIVYPLDMPSGITSVRFSAVDVVGMSSSIFTLQQQAQQHQGQRMAIDVGVRPYVTRQDAAPWIAFFLSLNGKAGTFRMGDPLGSQPRGSAGGTPLVAGGGQTGQVLNIDGATANITGWLLQDDKIQVGNYLYTILKDVNTNAFGQASLDIWPRLRSAPADNAAVIVRNAKGIWRLASNSRSWSVSEGSVYKFDFQAVEAT